MNPHIEFWLIPELIPRELNRHKDLPVRKWSIARELRVVTFKHFDIFHIICQKNIQDKYFKRTRCYKIDLEWGEWLIYI
jgi:hypothetical protein